MASSKFFFKTPPRKSIYHSPESHDNSRSRRAKLFSTLSCRNGLIGLPFYGVSVWSSHETKETVQDIHDIESHAEMGAVCVCVALTGFPDCELEPCRRIQLCYISPNSTYVGRYR